MGIRNVSHSATDNIRLPQIELRDESIGSPNLRVYTPPTEARELPSVSVAAKLLHHREHITGIAKGNFLSPVMVDIDPVDGVCNLDCAWCCQAQSRSSRPAKFMSPETMRRLGPFCRDWGVKAWRISGDSEPLLNRNIETLIQSGGDSGIDMGLITNGVFLDRIQSFSYLTYVGVSLDATNALTWSELKRSPPEGFKKIIRNVQHIRQEHPDLDLCIKFVRFHSETSLTKEQFSKVGTNFDDDPVSQSNNLQEAEELEDFAKNLGCRPITRDAYPTGFADTYSFSKCHATPLGGVFDASHQFHLCCDARSVHVLTDDYTRNDWQELPSLWGSDRHKQMIADIQPKKCAGCAKFKTNEILEHVVMTSEASESYQVNFI